MDIVIRNYIGWNSRKPSWTLTPRSILTL